MKLRVTKGGAYGVRRALARAPSIALWLGLPMAVATAAGAGCVRSMASAPPPDFQETDSSVALSGPDGGGGEGGGGPVAPQVLGLAVIYDTSLCAPGTTTVGPAPLRRISRVEYDNMVHDLLGDTTQPALQFESETPMSTGVNFETNTYTTVSATDTTIPGQYLTAAQTLAQTAVTSMNFNNLLTQYASSCSGNQQTQACANQFIDAFATAAFRGQYDSTEQQQLDTLFSTVQAQFNDFPTGIQAVITAVLTSPRFLFVLEFGQPLASNQSASPDAGVPVLLTPNELATRLSLFLWRSIPDSTLLSDASSGKLETAAGMQAEVQRMLASPKAQPGLEDFATQWMELQGTPTATKDTQYSTPQPGRVPWTTSLAQDLANETMTTFYNEVALEDGGAGGTLTEVLTSPSSYIDTQLASFYGVDGGTYDWTTRTSVNPPGQTIRAGILTNGSVLATQAHTSFPSPVLRGKLIREQVLCEVIGNPPAMFGGEPITPPPSVIPPGQTVNEQYLQHITDPFCSTCHQYMDPIGFGYANYDATGAYQSTDDNGFPDAGSYPPVDAGGQVIPDNQGPGELSISSFNGAVSLATQLASSPQVQECYALDQFRYSLGRIESASDACSLQQAFQAFSQQNFSLQAILVAIAQSDSFRYRNAVTAGSACQ